MQRYSLIDAVEVSSIAFGCMGLDRAGSITDCEALIGAALDLGINLFDHADIYGAGQSETLFGKVLERNPGWRQRLLVQSKCGIRFPGDTYGDGPPKRYDATRQHIVGSVDGSLRRLGVEQLDVLLLHRPDLLLETEEVAGAFDHLSAAGKVRFFGASNVDWARLELLSNAVGHRMLVNQVELSLAHHNLIAAGAWFNTSRAQAGSAATLDYCRRHDIRIQAWSPLAGGRLLDPGDQAPPALRETALKLRDLGKVYGTNPAAVALAWLLRHPAGIQPVVGVSSIDRLRMAADADRIVLSHEDWYVLLQTSQGRELP